MKQKITFLIFSIFACSAFATVKPIDCNRLVKGNDPSAVAIAFICSDLTVGLLTLDQSHANSLNTIQKKCSSQAFEATIAMHMDWLEHSRDKVVDIHEFRSVMQDQADSLLHLADSANKGRCIFPN